MLKMVLFVLLDLCGIQDSKDGIMWQNIFGSLECTQVAAGYLSRYCISNHMSICRYCWTRVTKLRWLVHRGLCARLNSNSAWIVKTCVAKASNDRSWRNQTIDF